jgi:hypothetical protein
MPPSVITALVTAMIAYGAALKAYAVYQAIATAVQWASNAAFLASPITWIILAIIALVAGIIYLATKTKFFQTVWAAVWGFLKKVGAWFAGPFANFFVMIGNKIKAFAIGAWNLIKAYFGFWYGMFLKVKGWGASAVDWLVSKWNSFMTFIKGIPKKVSGALSSMWNGLKSGFRSAINWVIGKWNGIRFSIPSFSILGKNFGGGSIGVPRIPQLADGGLVRARPGGTLVNVGEGGQDEAVVPLNRAPDLAQTREVPKIEVGIVGNETDFRRWLRKSVRIRGAFTKGGTGEVTFA